MKKILLIAILLSGCTSTSLNNTSVVDTADMYVGMNEFDDTQNIQDLIDLNPIEYAWCAAFVNGILRINNMPESDSNLLARSFLRWGESVDRQDVRPGDIVVLSRTRESWTGHVGFYIDTKIIDNKEYFVLLGGNQSNSVSYAPYSTSKLLGIRRLSSE